MSPAWTWRRRCEPSTAAAAPAVVKRHAPVPRRRNPRTYPMRNRILAAVVLALVLPVTAWAQGQPIVPKIQITGVRVGFPTAGQGSGFKAGAWTPVYVDLTAGLDRIGRADGSVFVQAEDSDDLQNYYVVP